MSESKLRLYALYLLSPSTILVVEVIIKLKNMIDDKKIETAKEEIYEDKFLGCGEMVEAQKVLGREIKPATVEEDGYLVEYKDGYKSWSPKSVFEEAYREVGSVNFGGAIDLLKAGLAVRRKGWNGKGLFIVKQVPSHIEGDIIPKMQSLPQSAKIILMNRENPHIDYTNQILIINPDGRADSWVPSVSDVFAEDWEVVTD